MNKQSSDFLNDNKKNKNAIKNIVQKLKIFENDNAN